jgi:DNA-binding FadR family transcriptional regulator
MLDSIDVGERAEDSNSEGTQRFAVEQIRPSYEQVAAQIRELLIKGDIQPGERLPSEAELATMFKVGRTTIREGFRLLASENLILTTRGVNGGTFVAPDADVISKYTEASLGLVTGNGRISIDELLAARELLEIPATRLAVENSDAGTLQMLRSTVPETPEPSIHMEHSAFHLAILKASRNQVLEVLTKPIFDILRTRLRREAAPTEFWLRVLDEHRDILSAIQRGDADGAAAHMSSHLHHLAAEYRAIDRALSRGEGTEGSRGDQ